MAVTATTRTLKSVPHSAQIGKCARYSFRKGSVRELVVGFLRKRRTYRELEVFVERLGASYTDILRFLRKTGQLHEEKGMVRWGL